MSEQFAWDKPENILDFALIRDRLVKLLEATENKVEREWPPGLGGNVWHSGPFLFALNTAKWTYVSTCYLLADKPVDPSRHLEYAIVVPPWVALYIAASARTAFRSLCQLSLPKRWEDVCG